MEPKELAAPFYCKLPAQEAHFYDDSHLDKGRGRGKAGRTTLSPREKTLATKFLSLTISHSSGDIENRSQLKDPCYGLPKQFMKKLDEQTCNLLALHEKGISAVRSVKFAQATSRAKSFGIKPFSPGQIILILGGFYKEAEHEAARCFCCDGLARLSNSGDVLDTTSIEGLSHAHKKGCRYYLNLLNSRLASNLNRYYNSPGRNIQCRQQRVSTTSGATARNLLSPPSIAAHSRLPPSVKGTPIGANGIISASSQTPVSDMTAITKLLDQADVCNASDLICSICRIGYKVKIRFAPCKHWYGCISCLKTTLNGGGEGGISCPMCKQPIAGLYNSFVLSDTYF